MPHRDLETLQGERRLVWPTSMHCRLQNEAVSQLKKVMLMYEPQLRVFPAAMGCIQEVVTGANDSIAFCLSGVLKSCPDENPAFHAGCVFSSAPRLPLP